VPVAIARSDNEEPAERQHQIERLHLDLIGSARKSIYIENQYFTSETIADSLIARLAEEDGPEVVMVLPRKNSGWLEEHTIEVLRFRVIARLRENDRYHRLRICYPKVPNLAGEAICVHSKILIVDDRFFRVGSSNLTNRSMRLDTECDLTIEARNAAQRQAIAEFRNRLVAEHLGMTAKAVAARLESGQSLRALIDSRASGARCLKSLRQESNSALIAAPALVDPPQPLSPLFVVQAITSWLSERPMFLLCPLAAVAVGAGLAIASMMPVRR
jgi:phosphatidylserine/phosphatidylglycerophosphate/cardiolipin synthase-like enzyme